MLEDAAATVLVTRRSLLPRSLAGRGLPPVLALDELRRGESAPCVARPPPPGDSGLRHLHLGLDGHGPRAWRSSSAALRRCSHWAREAFSRRGARRRAGVDLDLLRPLGLRALRAARAGRHAWSSPTNALELPSLPAAGAVTLVNTVPSAMAELLRLGGAAGLGAHREPGGRAAAARRWSSASTRPAAVERVLNLYGPSEDTTYSTFALVRRGERRAPPIGRPIAGTPRLRARRRRLRPVPVGRARRAAASAARAWRAATSAGRT